MRKKTFLLALVLICTMIGSVGCGRRMNGATDNTTTKNDTVEEDITDGVNDTVDGITNGVEDTMDGITNGVEDMMDGVDHSVNDTTEYNDMNTPSTDTNNTSR